MDQQQINEREWHSPANWHGGLLGIYSSEHDTRLLVPKRNRLMGWTFNFAHPGARFLVLLVLALVVAGIVANGWRR